MPKINPEAALKLKYTRLVKAKASAEEKLMEVQATAYPMAIKKKLLGEAWRERQKAIKQRAEMGPEHADTAKGSAFVKMC